MAAGKNRVVICGRIGYVTHRGYNRRFIDGFEKNSMPAINRKVDPACNQCIKDKGKLSAFCLVLTLGVIFFTACARRAGQNHRIYLRQHIPADSHPIHLERVLGKGS